MFEKKFSQFARAIAERRPAVAGVGPVGSSDALFARAAQDDDYDDEPRPRRAGKLRYEPGKKRNDTSMIIGIVVAVLAVIVVLVVVMQPKASLPTGKATMVEVKQRLFEYAQAIDLWARKLAEEQGTYPPSTDDCQPGSTFLTTPEYAKFKNQEFRGYRFYYSATADRKTYVIACAPINESCGVTSYYATNSANVVGEPMYYESEWKTTSDFEPPLNGQPPKVMGSWTKITIDTAQR